MMYLFTVTLLLLFNVVFGGVLILSPKKLEVSSLKPFDADTFQSLKSSFKNAKVVTFKINSEEISHECEHLTKNKFSAYVPSVDYTPENSIVLTHNAQQNCNQIKKKIRTLELENHKNIIYLIMHQRRKYKRSVETTTVMPSSSTTEESTPKTILEKTLPKEKIMISPDEPVLYDSDGKAMLYSSRAPILRVQNDSEYILGAASIVTIDNRDSYSRLICSIPVDDGKVMLRFRFPWDGGYWSLGSVEVMDNEGKTYNLTITSPVSAPRTFSHRCGGETIFSDGSSSLILYDMQVQPQTKNGRFSDAYNCVPFMTAPIWSGIFVSSILFTGLIIGLGALGSIKTMDKFDNSKTKQLTITLMGE